MLGAVGQVALNLAQQVRLKPLRSYLESEWSPVIPLSDEQYKELLEEKVLKVEAEIALVDENIAAARARQKARQADPK